MESLGFNTLCCVLSFLDVKSMYYLLVTSKRSYQHWGENLVWCTVQRDLQWTASFISHPHFSLDDCNHFKTYLYAKMNTVLPRQLTTAVLNNFHRATELQTQGCCDFSLGSEESGFCEKQIRNHFLGEGPVITLQNPAFLFWVRFQAYSYLPHRYVVRVGSRPGQWDFVSSPQDSTGVHGYQYLLLFSEVTISKFLQFVLVEQDEAVLQAEDLFIRSVACVGLPVTDSKVAIEMLQPDPSPDNFLPAIYRLVASPDLCHRTSLNSLERIFKLSDYFREAFRCKKALTKCEMKYLAKDYVSGRGHFAIQIPTAFWTEELGNEFFASGAVSRAYRIFKALKHKRKLVKCLLVMQQFEKCLKLFPGKTYVQAYAKMQKIAKSLGKKVSSNLDAHIQSHATPQPRKAKKL